MKALLFLLLFTVSCTPEYYEQSLFREPTQSSIDDNFFEKGSEMQAIIICHLKDGSKEVMLIPPTVNGNYEVEYDVTWSYERIDGQGVKTQKGLKAIIKAETNILCRMQAKRVGTNIKSNFFHCVVN